MTPDFRIEVEGENITEIIRDRLISLMVTDQADTQSDRAEFALDDRDSKFALPRKGAILRVWLGYRETELLEMGKYTVDEIAHDGPPATLTVRAKGADMIDTLKVKKTRSWHQVTVAQMIAEIAASHGLKAKVDDKLGAELIAHIDQTTESDPHFLYRLANDRDAVRKIQNGYLVFVSKADSKTVSGQLLPVHEIFYTDLDKWSYNAQERGSYKSVVGYWQDKANAVRVEVKAGAGDPVKPIRNDFPSESEAIRGVDAELRRINRGKATLNVDLSGRLEIGAQSKINVSFLKPEIDGLWLVNRVEHRYDGGGLTTKLETEIPTNL
jgi:phage protein D